MEREGGRLLVEFVSRDGRRLYRTLEEVMLYPEERITFRHLEGPLKHASEEFQLSEVPEARTSHTRDRSNAVLPFCPAWVGFWRSSTFTLNTETSSTGTWRC